MPNAQESAVVTRTDKEIKTLSKSPLWVFGWGLLLTSLTFISNVLIDLNEQNANIAKFNSLSHIYELDERKTTGTKDALLLVVKGALDAASYFSDHVQKQPRIDQIPNEVVEEASRLIAEARGGINAELSVLSSLHFTDPQLTSHIEGFKTDLESLDEYFATKESICKSIAEKKFTDAQSELDKLKTRDYKKERQLQAFPTRVQAFERESQLKREASDADLQYHDAQLTTFRYKVYLLLPMSGIVGAFAAIVLKRFRKVAV